MSAPTAARTIDPNAPGVRFGAQLAVELRKLVDTRGPQVLLGILALLWLGVIATLSFAGSTVSFATGANGFGAVTRIFVGVLAILLVTSEWGQRSVVSAFTLEPRRERVIAAKLGAALIAAGVLLGLGLALAALIAAVRGGSFGDAALTVRGAGIRALFDVLMAFAMGLAILNTAGAIVGYIVLPEILVPVLLLLISLPSADDLSSGGTVYNKIAPWVYPQDSLSALSEAGAGGLAWARVLVCAVLWIGLPAVIGVYRVMSSEVK
ncbi:hypothetical protein GOHSU_62_00080 [Gordonia hirsuta DSM 44140 = NBRC 16056]|uniref:ABC transporter permease protein n=1 Tax=Gordonia hirsuta DSM 44140 = NBRC 16056 TaxID=1121927 RepID=L7LCW7_9ACTN|nr:hypothetical protein [Gordonia hirsuta]GAC58955.1 hypothetical protein GOHSU_62_00080 [Gordonia hirsuta DSM 44140 = NBRC 16056]